MKEIFKSKEVYIGITIGFITELIILGILTIIMASMGLIA